MYLRTVIKNPNNHIYFLLSLRERVGKFLRNVTGREM